MLIWLNQITDRLVVAIIILAILAFQPALEAQEFKVESKVFVGNSKTPATTNIVLFADNVIYDFNYGADTSKPPREVVILDKRQRKMILLDMQQKRKLEMFDINVIKVLESVQAMTAEDPRSEFLVKEQFKESTDLTTGWVTLKSNTIAYQFTGKQPDNVGLLPDYFAYLDNFTRLIASDPKRIPPFPKLRLNQSIKQLGWFPSEINVSMKPNSLIKQPFAAKSKQTLTVGLTQADREKIASAKSDWLNYELVNLHTYRGLPGRPSFKSRVVPASFQSDVKQESDK